jgi:N-acyl-L-homoserine lactone synthetase
MAAIPARTDPAMMAARMRFFRVMPSLLTSNQSLLNGAARIALAPSTYAQMICHLFHETVESHKPPQESEIGSVARYVSFESCAAAGRSIPIAEQTFQVGDAG